VAAPTRELASVVSLNSTVGSLNALRFCWIDDQQRREEITLSDVAAAALQFLGSVFSKTTGAQIPVDGGNDRVI
jgi:hypothetical protein